MGEQQYIIDALERDGIEYEIRDGRIYTIPKKTVDIIKPTDELLTQMIISQL